MILSERELACLKLAADGLTYAEIGQQLHISRRGVKTHISHAIEKLEARNTTHAVAIAHHEGLLGEPDQRAQVGIVRLAEQMGCWIALVPGRSADEHAEAHR